MTHRFQPGLASLFAAIVVVGAGAGCDIRPLSPDELFGARDAGTPEHSPGDAGDGSTSSDADAPTDGASTDVIVPPSDTRPGCVPSDCAADQYCDELSHRCASRFGTGMLSGVVHDACTGASLDARVGIAGQRQCSAGGKGSFFFANLPLGTLKLAAFKVGYRPYDANIVVGTGGTIADVTLTPDTPGGCGEPPPPTAACTCTEPGCQI